MSAIPRGPFGRTRPAAGERFVEIAQAQAALKHEYPEYQRVTDGWGTMPSKAAPAHLSTVPFLWQPVGTLHRMELVGGILGLDNRDDFVTPELGWAVIHARG